MGIIEENINYLREDKCTLDSLLQLSYQIKANILARHSIQNLRNYLKEKATFE